MKLLNKSSDILMLTLISTSILLDLYVIIADKIIDIVCKINIVILEHLRQHPLFLNFLICFAS